jgi:hypothetical protein
MKAVVHASDNTFSALGQDMKKRIAMQVKFYESMLPMTMKAISIEGQSDLMRGMDDFLCNFDSLYLRSEAFRGNLMVGLMTTFVAKLEDERNPQYSQRVLNFMLALSASGNRKAFQFVSANLCSVSVQRIACITSQKRSAPFIDLDEDEMVFRVKEHIRKIRSRCVEAGLSERCAFTVGFDGTVLASPFRFTIQAMAMQLLEGCTQTIFCHCQKETLVMVTVTQLPIFWVSARMERKGKQHRRSKFVCYPSNVPLLEQLHITHLLVGHKQLMSKVHLDVK